ncbi:aspartate carbamoyltransferase [Candidatus Nephthysia bennettiae]|uniref:Aspartate carbamoyltransferase n=1 Tax=Candidatus Nephthysia bennettiae TaxID=3127016 RepID=A0A934KBF0_9BACT|nr:aspartate carbamoyltransferase [Candidatus Dormibacteraeota bacterium]MBJ7612910.1 aspartate carbamoyltransferase [Candidatus Dormibacteraeota bacterium]
MAIANRPTRPADFGGLSTGGPRHVLESQQFSRELLDEIFDRADAMRADPRRAASRLQGRIMAALFYEPSTRTRLSFESAMLRLGGRTIGTDNAREFSSAAKGETLEDTVRILGGYADVIVLRHHEQGAAVRAAAVSDVPVINAGDGKGQHPTQALLDLYTIKDELGRVDGVRVAIVGDLANGRTARSLAYLLSKYKDVELWFVAPNQVQMGQDIKDHLNEHQVRWQETGDLDEVLPTIDVVYQTRIQKERFADDASYQAVRGVYVVDQDTMGRLSPYAIVMHPLPRVDEIDPAIDSDPRAAYFRQARNGVQIRMALLDMVVE